MQREIENTESPDELNWKMAQAGEELGKLFRGEDDLSGEGDVLSGGEGTEVLVGGEDETTTMDDGRVLKIGGGWDEVSVPFRQGTVAATPMATGAETAELEAGLLKAAETDPLLAKYEKSLAETMGAPALTTEAANKQAKQVLGIDEKEDVPDWAMPLFAFGMALMAEPGSFGQAVGKAGLKTLPVIAQVKKEKKAERFRVAQIARDLMKTDVATRKGALSNAVSLIFKKRTESRADKQELRAINKELRQTKDAEAKRKLEQRKFELSQKQYKLKVFDSVTKSIDSLVKTVPENSRLPVALALSDRISDPKTFGVVTGDPTPGQMNAFSTNLFKTTVENLAKSGKNPELLLSVMGYAPSDQHKDYIERKVTVNQPVTNAEGVTVPRQMERLVRLNIVPVTDFERDENGQIARDANDKPIVKTYAPGTLQVTLDASGKILEGGNADPNWKGGTRVETVNGEQRSFSGTINGKPFWDEAGKFWKQGQNFTKNAGDEGKPLKTAEAFSSIIRKSNGDVQIVQGTTPDVGKVLGRLAKGTATSELNNATTEVVALTRNWTQLRDLVSENEAAILAAYNLQSIQGAILKASDYFFIVNKERPGFERILDGLDIFKNFGTGKGQQQATLGNTDIRGKGGLKNYVNNVVSKKGYVADLKGVELDGADGTRRAMSQGELSALQGLATMRKESRSMVFNLAYALARTNEPGGRLTDRDIANALMMMGVTEDGSFRPRELINAMDRQVANRQAGIVDQYVSNTMPTAEEIKNEGKVPDAIPITKESIFNRYNVRIFEPPSARRFEKSDLRSRGENVSIDRINAQNIARDVPTIGANPELYNPDTQTFNQDRLEIKLEAVLRLLKKDPENADLLARKGNLGEVIKRLRPGQATR